MEILEEEIFEAITTENLPKVILRHQITDLGGSDDIKQDKYKKREANPYNQAYHI